MEEYKNAMSKSTESKPEFSDRLRAARMKRQLSQGELANRAGLQASVISNFETGTRKPSFDNLRSLADALDVTTDYLLGRVTHTYELVGPDRLHRHYDRLTNDDLEIADQFLEVLAKRASRRSETEAE